MCVLQKITQKNSDATSSVLGANNSLQVLPCLTIFYHASLSVTFLIQFWMLIFPGCTLTLSSHLNLIYQSFLLQVVSTLLFFSPTFLYSALQYAQSILFAVLFHIWLYLYVRFANLFPHLFLFSNSHLNFYWAMYLPHHFPFKHSQWLPMYVF